MATCLSQPSRLSVLGALRAHVFASAPKISKTFVSASRLEPLKFC